MKVDPSGDFAIPSPKRQRVEDANTVEPADDFDDIYGPPKHVSPDLAVSPDADVSTETSAIHSLPGLNHAQSHQPLLVEASDVAQREEIYPKHASPTNLSHKSTPQVDDKADGKAGTSPALHTAEEMHDGESEELRVEVAGQDGEDAMTVPAKDPGRALKTHEEVQTEKQSIVKDSDRTHNAEEAEIDISHTQGHNALMLLSKLEEVMNVSKTNEEAEFEIDSSPIQSSDSDSSDDSTSSEDGLEDDYEMLDPIEQAARLMKEDAGSDDEVADGKNKPHKEVRTANEKPVEEVHVPEVTLTENTKIEELGHVEHVLDREALIKAKTSGEYRVLDYGSLLCLEDKTILGVIVETIGRVQQPYYTVRSASEKTFSDGGVSKDTRAFYVVEHSKYVFTAPLQAIKGSDASNIHDEEVGDDEMEFSDDEAEVEHKRRVKLAKQARRDGKEPPPDGFSKGPRGARGRGRGGPVQRNFTNNHHGSLHVSEQPQSSIAALNYDDGPHMNPTVTANGDDLYTPLARPKDWQAAWSQERPPLPQQSNAFNATRGAEDRGRGRGRGGDRAGFNPRASGARPFHPQTNGNMPTNDQLSSRSSPHYPHTQFAVYQAPIQHFQPGAQSFQPHQYQDNAYRPYPSQTSPNFQSQAPNSYNDYYQQAYSNAGFPNGSQMYHQTQPQFPNFHNIPAGAHINPAFFQQQSANQSSNTWQPPQQDYGYRGRGR